jgi:hypothetical protein
MTEARLPETGSRAAGQEKGSPEHRAPFFALAFFRRHAEFT